MTSQLLFFLTTAAIYNRKKKNSVKIEPQRSCLGQYDETMPANDCYRFPRNVALVWLTYFEVLPRCEL